MSSTPTLLFFIRVFFSAPRNPPTTPLVNPTIRTVLLLFLATSAYHSRMKTSYLRYTCLFLLSSACLDLEALQSGRNRSPDQASAVPSDAALTVNRDMSSSVSDLASDLAPPRDPPIPAAGCRSGYGYPVRVGTGGVQIYACPGTFTTGKAFMLCAVGFSIPIALSANCTNAVTVTHKAQGFFAANVLYGNAAPPYICQWQNQPVAQRYIGGCGDASQVETVTSGCGSSDRRVLCNSGLSSFACPFVNGSDGDFITGLSNTDPNSGVICLQ